MTKLKIWFKRYIYAEIIGTVTALLGANLVYYISDGNPVLTAFAGTWGENTGYYGSIIFRDIKKSRAEQKKYTLISFVKDIRNIILEFGPAEVLDSFLIRPFMMYAFTSLTGNFQVGTFIGKLAADVIFYIPTIIAFELKSKYLKK